MFLPYIGGVSEGCIGRMFPQAEFGPQLWASGEHAELLAGCSVVVGMHPDQATDAIVDFALQAGKPFAVIPCCVFPR